MHLQTERVILDITFDNDVHDLPSTWNWRDLLDMPASTDTNDGECFTLSTDDD